MKKRIILMILFAPLASFASETRWELSREGSRSVTTRSENGNRLSVAFDFDGNRQPLGAQWSFSSPYFRAGGLTRSGFASFFDNRNLSSDGKRNGAPDSWKTGRSSATVGFNATPGGGAGFYAARHPDWLVTGAVHRLEISDRVSAATAVEWYGAETDVVSDDWYFSENSSRESHFLRTVHGLRYRTKNGHDAGLYVSSAAGSLNPASAALLFIYEYKNPLREILFKSAWYGDGYLFKSGTPSDRSAVFFFSYKENFEKSGYFRFRLGFDLPPVPDLFYILPFETFGEIRGEFRRGGWRLFAENRLTLASDKEGSGFLKNRSSAVVSWQGLAGKQTAVGAAVSARCTYTSGEELDFKAEGKFLLLYRRQSFSLVTSIEDGRCYVFGGECVFRLPFLTVEIEPQWEWKEGVPNGGLEMSFGI